MYLIAGIVILRFIFTESPINAHGFTEDERALVLLQFRANNPGAENFELKLNQVIKTFTSWKFWAIFPMGMLFTVGSGVASTFASACFWRFGLQHLRGFTSQFFTGCLGHYRHSWIWKSRSSHTQRAPFVSAGCVPVILGCCLL